MPIFKKERDDYEQGLHDRQKSVFDQVVNDLVISHPDTEPYHKGRRGEPLDGDKNRKR
jgi:hypothetical protein